MMQFWLRSSYWIPRGRGAQRWLALLVMTLLLSGCAEEQGIRVYEVAKQDDRGGRSMAATPAAVQEQQMLGAIVPDGKKYWVFKLLGDPEKVAKNRDEFLQIVNSLQFDAGTPRWQLSDGWTDQLLGGITYAELRKDSDALRATVTELPVMEQWQELVKRNVNRWRDQLDLEPRDDWNSIEPELEEVEALSQGENKAYFVSLKGMGSGQMSGGMGPFQRAQAQANAAPSETTAEPPAAPEKPKLDYRVPETWLAQDVSQNPMRLAAFEVAAGDEQAELTIIPASGAIESNLGIWFNQVGLEPSETAVQKVMEQATQVQVNDLAAKIYELDGGADQESILVADIPWRDEESLFVKLKGKSQVVATERDRFEEFVESIRW
ncbi:MAG: hypothetical protein NXI32_20070 [bacterium]|nr:hypothetical protein [bacterium]